MSRSASLPSSDFATPATRHRAPGRSCRGFLLEEPLPVWGQALPSSDSQAPTGLVLGSHSGGGDRLGSVTCCLLPQPGDCETKQCYRRGRKWSQKEDASRAALTCLVVGALRAGNGDTVGMGTTSTSSHFLPSVPGGCCPGWGLTAELGPLRENLWHFLFFIGQ